MKEHLTECNIEVVKGLMKIGFPMDMRETEDGVYEAYCTIKRACNLFRDAFDIIIHTEHKRNIIGKTSWRYVVTTLDGEELFASKFTFETEDEAYNTPMLSLIEKIAAA